MCIRDSNNRITGGAGRDILYAGAGIDTQMCIRDRSTMLTTRRDTIFDFTSSDKIDLRSIDSNTRVAGNQDFTFIGTGQFTNTAGEVRYQRLASDTMIYGDVDGNGVADFSIHLDDALTLSRTYFLL